MVTGGAARCGILPRMEHPATNPATPADWLAEVARPLPPVPSARLYTGAPEGVQFREREAIRALVALAALAAGLHQPVQGSRRDPTRWLAGGTLVAGGFGLLTHHRWPEEATLIGCGLAVGAMLARPASFDPLATVAAATATLALADLCRVPRRFRQ